ncbi:MAG TPA: hypothetical protein VMB52_04095 [Verrucomicrobiae bacterium]|nr:hypothetical protein [Verrucomicrobiae bacterium]
MEFDLTQLTSEINHSAFGTEKFVHDIASGEQLAEIAGPLIDQYFEENDPQSTGTVTWNDIAVHASTESNHVRVARYTADDGVHYWFDTNVNHQWFSEMVDWVPGTEPLARSKETNMISDRHMGEHFTILFNALANGRPFNSNTHFISGNRVLPKRVLRVLRALLPPKLIGDAE